MIPTASGRQFLRTMSLVALSIAVLFTADTFLARTEEAESRAEAARRFQEAQQLLAQGHNQEAVERLKDALELQRDNRNYQLALAQAQLAAGQLADSEATVSSVLLHDSTNGPANLTMARVLLKEGQTRQAISYYHRALYGEWKDDPAGNRLKVRFELIDLLAQQNLKEELLAELLAVQEEAPSDLPTKLKLGQLFLEAGSPAHAVDMFREVLKEDPENVAASVGRGEAEFARGDYRAAIVNFSNAVGRDPSNPAAQKGLSLSNQVLELDPTRRGLGPAERFRESRKLLQLSLEEATRCAGPNPQPAVGDLLDEARKSLQESVAAARQDAAAEGDIELAERLWQVRKSCGQPDADDPLALVLAKIAQ